MSNWQQQIYDDYQRRQASQPAKRQTTRKPKVDYKAIFLTHLKMAKLPQPACEFRFHETRRWRFDFAFPAQMIAIEYQGLNWKPKKGQDNNSGHQSIDGLRRDCAKFTEASLAGWRLILITAETVNNGQAVEWVRRALNQPTNQPTRGDKAVSFTS